MDEFYIPFISHKETLNNKEYLHKYYIDFHELKMIFISLTFSFPIKM